MLKPEQVPNVVAQAAHDVFWNAVYNGKPIDLEIEFHRLFHYAVAAAVNAWPGMERKDFRWRADTYVEESNLVLPLTEPRDD